LVEQNLHRVVAVASQWPSPEAFLREIGYVSDIVAGRLRLVLRETHPDLVNSCVI
jgi:hypothetical protein